MRTVERFGRVREVPSGRGAKRVYAWPPGAREDEPLVYQCEGTAARGSEVPLEHVLECLWEQVEYYSGWRFAYAEGRFL